MKSVGLTAILCCIFICDFANAGVPALDTALRATYAACVGIDDALADLKRMAGINTAITGVGTATGVGATATGLVKASKDKRIAEIEVKLEELRRIESQPGNTESTDVQFSAFMTEFNSSRSEMMQQLEGYEAELDKLNRQSKSLGNWRTGLLAGTTVTNTAGAIIAGANKVDADLQSQIDACVGAVDSLRNVMMQARIDGADISEAEEIAAACGEYEYVDISPINKRARGATISGAVGAGTGLIGTIVSGAANTDATRDGDAQKEKNLNAAANALSAGATVASATATVFNATQINAIKKVANVAAQCTGVLK